jgi:hypothetical protein
MHLFDSILNGVVLLGGPLVLIGLMAGGLVAIDRLFQFLGNVAGDASKRDPEGFDTVTCVKLRSSLLSQLGQSALCSTRPKGKEVCDVRQQQNIAEGNTAERAGRTW